MIPAPDQITGLLPPGRHRANWAEIEDVFVEKAPHVAERRLLFTRLRDWAEQCWSILPKAELWLDGSFVRYDTAQAPFDVDVVAFVEVDDLGSVLMQVQGELNLASGDARLGGPPRKCPFAVRWLSLWTLENVRSPGLEAPKIQPFGSSVDGFYAQTSEHAKATWHRSWSGVAAGGPEKGYLQVVPGV